jgi:hypothetical protein
LYVPNRISTRESFGVDDEDPDENEDPEEEGQDEREDPQCPLVLYGEDQTVNGESQQQQSQKDHRIARYGLGRLL